MKILIYSEIHEGYGTGNIIRSKELAYFLKMEHEVRLATNDNIKANGLFNEKLFHNLNSKENPSFDVAIIDSPSISETTEKKVSDFAITTIAFDYFNYRTENIEVIINLFNHNKEEIHHFNGKIFSGVEYAILRKEILSNRRYYYNSPDVPNILITFGGEDPQNNTEKAIKRIRNIDNKTNIKIILGKYKKYFDLDLKEVEVIRYVNKMGKLMKSSDLVICGGGTTMLEAMYIGIPVIAVPQNEKEANFINYLKGKIRIFSLSEIDEVFRIISDPYAMKFIGESYKKIIDGKGKERIKKIVNKENYYV